MKSLFDISTKNEVAKLLHVSPNELDNLAARIFKFYRVKEIPKRSGGFRKLNIPMGRLIIAQRKINQHVFGNVEWPEHLHGWIKHRSAITNARNHVGKPAILTADIKDYYPSVTPARVNKIFERLGIRGEAARLLTTLTTYKFQLPQGSPTSPALANLAIPRIDARLCGLARAQRFTYTRFGDDFSLSGSKNLAKFSNLVGKIVREDDFALKSGEAPVLTTNNEQQTVTKLVVNRKLNAAKEKRIETLRSVAQSLSSGEDLDQSTRGRLAWINSVNRNVGRKLVRKSRTRKRWRAS